MDNNLQDILTNTEKENTLIITINREKYKNALRTNTLKEISETLEKANDNASIRCIIITGGEKVFAAGADINELEIKSSVDSLKDERTAYWEYIKNYKKPIIAVVNGFCLGGGCELAMHCDIIIAGDKAKFGQPEINLGIMPGAGGTQRLTKTIGKSNSMLMLLSGLFIDASRALELNLVSEVLTPSETLNRALEIASIISLKSPLAIECIKKSVLNSFDMTLSSGLAYEKMVFSSLLNSEDKKEGIKAFKEKRLAIFKGK